jgi:RimJ/RimL family protein N-acetyltransferase
MAYGWEGSKVRLAPLDEEKHLENCLAWINDPDITDTLSIGVFPMSRPAQIQWIQQMSAPGGSDVVFAIETLEGRHIGNSGIHRIDWVARSAMTGTVIGAKDIWGQGYGTEAARLRARYCFEQLNLEILFSEFIEGNERSRRMQEACGYEVWGVKPLCYRVRGERRNAPQTVLTRERWLSLQG